ncbi:hypothetical protein L6E12_14110 [Actinokineospora sp. PR83]|uniref:hypothetical protein n=1 Tax=Actinokineospora sp. PR83 TaxID=2884908 RepID=UPI001F39045F|nr:hypothetical protein [Actinokineospora sp. PR83]MCG8916925.1 hypothetical protein [Actinokineospora sp. PR83]
MDLVPEHRAVLGVDIAGSASVPEDAMTQSRQFMQRALRESLTSAGIPDEEVLKWADRGDGALVTVPATRVGALLDAAHHVDGLTIAHNRLHRPVRVRLSVELGPVAPGDSLSRTRVDASRLLDADAFKALFTRCAAEATDDRATTALIIPDRVLNVVFEGHHTTHVRRGDFAPLPITVKEYSGNAWVRIPGFDSTSLTSLRQPQPQPQEHGGVVNTINGNVTHAIQAHTINGGITFGGRW